MVKQSGLGDNLYVSGYDLSGDVNSIDKISSPIDTGDFTGIKKFANERLALLRAADWQFTSFFDVVAGPSSYAFQVLQDTPLLWWKFADVLGSATAADSSGNARTGTPSNVTFGADGPLPNYRISTAGLFNGTSSEVTSSYNPNPAACSVGGVELKVSK